MHTYDRQFNAKAVELAALVLRMTTEAGSGHPSSALSLAHLVTVLMYDHMRYDPRNPWNSAADRLILSEGHAVPIIYAAYADIGGAYGASPEEKRFLSVDDLKRLREIDSVLDGHPNPSAGFPFFDSATGSLGQGLSSACGLILAARLDAIEKKAYVLIGDGESREGQVWEACDFLVEYNLCEAIPVFNCNGLGQSESVSGQQSPERLSAKLRAYGFETIMIDGHQPRAIKDALSRASEAQSPHAIIARTVKGWGVEALRKTNYHGKTLKAEALDAALEELDDFRRAIGGEPASMPGPSAPPQIAAGQTRELLQFENPDFDALLADDPYRKKFHAGFMSTRRAYGLALRQLAAVDERIVALDGDVKNSTYAQDMARTAPARFFESRIAEQNMISVAAGLAAAGKVPFVSSFAKFLVRGYDQLELALIAGARIKLCGSHAGANIGADGPSQMGLTDFAYMQSLTGVRASTGNPLLVMFNPSCGVAAYKCVGLMANYDGACYMRTIRSDLPILYNPEETFEIGGVKELRRGEDVVLFGSGYMVHACLVAAQKLNEQGISACVVDCYGFPLNTAPVIDAIERVEGRVLTVEDNYGNGLGAAVASIAGQSNLRARIKQLFVKNAPKSGRTSEDVLRFVHLSTEDIIEAARASLTG